MVQAKKIKVAIAGNPNSGKTSVFNRLVGARRHVGNWPGVTVEKAVGICKYRGYQIEFIDLPGTYSLSAYSKEEIIARNYLIQEKPDVVLNVIDGTNLERNLYFTTQLMEMKVPLVLAINIYDEVEQQKIKIDIKQLAKLLGVYLVPTSTKSGKGMTTLLAEIINRYKNKKVAYKMEYYEDIEEKVKEIVNILEKDKELENKYSKVWLAIKLLEKDSQVYKILHDRPVWIELEPLLNKEIKYLEKHFKQDVMATLTESRYAFIHGALQETVEYTEKEAASLTDIIDNVLINRVLGLPIFLFLMWLVFQLTFTLGEIPMLWLERLFEIFGHTLSTILPAGFIKALLVDGVIAGVGGVLVFLPNILILFLAISLLETTGYMSRAAFVMDRIMHRIGLHGRSFIPMLMGFGCSVPAFMACRTLKNENDRLATALVIPFMSCGAKLPVYVLLTGAFFPKEMAGNILFGIYIFGVIVAVIMAKLLKTYVFRGLSEPFVMELPPYRLPALSSILVHVWEKAWMYLRKAGTVILGFAVVIWFLSNLPTSPSIEKEYGTKINLIQFNKTLSERKKVSEIIKIEHEKASEQLAYSYAGKIGKSIEPLIRPLGFNWEIGVALVAGFAAKEIVVSTLGTIYAIEGGSEALRENLRDSPHFSPLIALSLMVFVLLYVPCIAATAVFHKEMGAWKWTWFYIFFTTGTAYFFSLVVYQGGRLLGF
ncbi:MAG: ferrous iron transport protein B [Candidatus Margulisbacteria bacterium]|nr:ferrous iron transport protein B [Candidatus Margulisiibacteriota bacterium]